MAKMYCVCLAVGQMILGIEDAARIVLGLSVLHSVEEVLSMPTGPQGQKRPTDAVRCAIMVAKLSTGEMIEELHEPSGRVRSGHAGSQARAAKLTKEERSAIAKKAAHSRWYKQNASSTSHQDP